ncbi:MAG: hypothetical protein JO337_02330 [Acidimicrobiales bacterium]|nr:hypothetical protein [Acidimicrobiales bacterium]
MESDSPEVFAQQSTWLERARRLGPLQYSALGPRLLQPPSPGVAGWLADFLDCQWEQHGRPDPLTAAVVSGDDGALAREVLRLGPACLSSLRYILVDPVVGPDRAARAETAARLLPLENPAFLFPSGRPPILADGLDADEEDPFPPATGIGPLTARLSGLPTLSIPGSVVVVVAIDALSRLASDRVEWRGGQWLEVRLAAAAGGGLVDVTVPLVHNQTNWQVPVDPGSLPDGARFALLTGAVAWLRAALATAPDGGLAVVDRWTVNTRPLESPYDEAVPPALGLDQLRRVREPLRPAPEPLVAPAPPGLSVVSWRIG